MAHPVDDRLTQLGITLPAAPAPAANYLPYVASGNQLFIAGQAPVIEGRLRYAGRLGAEFTVTDGQAAARLAAVNVLAQVKLACGGDWAKLARCLRLCGYLNATAEFTEHPQVLDGASDFLVAVLGDAGRHVRTVMGASSLRGGSVLVLDALFELRR